MALPRRIGNLFRRSWIDREIDAELRGTLVVISASPLITAM
jgi:hypothetical protein